MLTKPKTFVKEDIPTPTEMEEYLARICSAKDCFPQISGFPELPENMKNLSYKTANDIEQLLLMVHNTIGNIEKSRIYSGELQSGGF